MNTNPPELNAQDFVSEHKADLNIKTAVGSKRAAIVLIMSLLASTVPLNVSAKAESSVSGNDLNNLVFLSLQERISNVNWKQLLEMSWPEIESRLEKMSWSKIEHILNLLSDITKDTKGVIDTGVGVKIADGDSLSDEDKNFFIEMVDKYNISDADIIKNIVNKENLTSRNFDYLLVKFKEILRKQKECAMKYIQIRSWIGSQMNESSLFDSGEELQEWMNTNSMCIQSFRKLADALERYEKSLVRSKKSDSGSSMMSPYVPYQEKRGVNIQSSNTPSFLPKENNVRRGQTR